jgi:hypothetical protein
MAPAKNSAESEMDHDHINQFLVILPPLIYALAELVKAWNGRKKAKPNSGRKKR